MLIDHARALRFFKRLTKERRDLWGVDLLRKPGPGEATELAIAHPSGLAALAGYLKRTAPKTSDGRPPVFCRGESENHVGLKPSLFRRATSGGIVLHLVAAEARLEDGVKSTFKQMARFSERDISAILQHYGVRTTWVDLVDNLFIAVWFALNTATKESGRLSYERSRARFGFVKFVQPWVDGLPQLRVKDLRAEFLPLSLRPQAQHGVSVTRWTREQWSEANTDLRAYVVAKVRIPNDSKLWGLSGFMFGAEFLFPAPDHDHTYRTLLRRQMPALLRRIEREANLPARTLGSVPIYRHVARNAA